MLALLNGRSISAMPVTDRGLAYGDGLFETIKVVDGHPQFLRQHLARLCRDCLRLDIRLDVHSLRAEIYRLATLNRSGVLKLIVTRSAFARGYQTPPGATGERLALFYPQCFDSLESSRGVQVRVCRQRLAEQPVLAGMKHLNRLEQVLARAEWSDPAIAEGLMLDRSSRLIEGVFSNVFLVRSATVYTPRLHRCGVAGVIRELVLQHMTECVPVREADLSLDDLSAADEVFLTNSLSGIRPVLKIGCLHKSQGDVTIALQKFFQTLCSRDALENGNRTEN